MASPSVVNITPEKFNEPFLYYILLKYISLEMVTIVKFHVHVQVCCTTTPSQCDTSHNNDVLIGSDSSKDQECYCKLIGSSI